MKIKPEELVQNGYVLLDSLHHQEIVPFIRLYLKKRTRISYAYTFSNVLFAGWIAWWFYQHHNDIDFKLEEAFTHFSYGLGLAFVLIPIHEYIHVLAYKSQGASNTSYDANLKKFYFMAIADQFVANRKEFQIVALAPIVTISFILMTLLFFADKNWSLTILGILLTHTAFCSGDFGLLSYFEFHKEKEIVTYDDKTNGITYFYGKQKRGGSFEL